MIQFCRDKLSSVHEKYGSESWTSYECDVFALTDKLMLLIYMREEKSDIPHFHIHLKNDFEHCICRICLPKSVNDALAIYPCDDDKNGFSKLSTNKKLSMRHVLRLKNSIYGSNLDYAIDAWRDSAK